MSDKKQVRIAEDASKASKYLIEILVNGVWEEKYRFGKRQKAQDIIDRTFVNCEQLKDFKYER